MSTINENPRVSDVVLYEEGRDIEFTRQQVTVVSGTAASGLGQVMAQITASGKWTQVAPAASDGSQNAAGVLIAQPFSAQLSADAQATLITRGPAVVKSGGLAWTSGMTGAQKTAALAQLAALGILARTDYGV